MNADPFRHRGFSCLGLVNPKTAENVGGVMRAAGVHSVSQINIENRRRHAKHLNHAANTVMAHRHTPTFFVDDVLAYLPHDTQVVAVDLIDGAAALPTFCHPERAFYVFGPEDGTLDAGVTSRAQHIVYVPTRHCMNLAATVNVVLYDRMCKQWLRTGASIKEPPAPKIYRRAK